MRTSLSLTTTAALLLVNCANGQPTRSARAEVPLGSGIPSSSQEDNGTKIRLHRRGSAELTREDGAVDFNRAHAHLARAQTKYARSIKNFQANTGVSHFLDPSLLPPSVQLGTTNPSLARRNAWGDAEASSLDWSADLNDTPAGLEKRDRLFSDRHLVGAPSPVSGSGAEEVVVVHDPSARKRQVVGNPKSSRKARTKPSASTSAPVAAAETKIPRAPTAAGNALVDYQDGMLWHGTLAIGTPPVNYIIDFDTGSADLWIPSVDCNAAACNTHTKYNPASSSTSTSVPGAKLSITYGDGSSTKGTVWKDSVTVAGITATQQTFGAANSLSSDWEDDPMDGMMGMSYGSISQLGATPFFQTLMTQGAVASGQFSFYLASQNSELYLGGKNPALYRAGTTVSYPVTSQSYWLLSARANVGASTIGSLGSFQAIIDTGTSVIVAPTADVAKFWSAVPGSGVYGGGYYTFPCASPPSVSFSFGSTNEKWAIAPGSLNLGKVSSGSDRCVGAIVGADVGVNAWILGASFMENVYTTFDFDNNQVSFSDLAY